MCVCVCDRYRTAGFQKNEHWASCKTSCTAGIDPADPPEYATPWTCKARCFLCSHWELGISWGFPWVSHGVHGFPAWQVLSKAELIKA